MTFSHRYFVNRSIANPWPRLNQCVEFNQKMYLSVQELRNRTESLKRDIETILSMQPHTPSFETSWSSRTSSLELQGLQDSSPDSHNLDEEGSITVRVAV